MDIFGLFLIGEIEVTTPCTQALSIGVVSSCKSYTSSIFLLPAIFL